MLVKDLMTKEVQTCQPEDTLERAAQLMWDRDCGCLPVCRANHASHAVGMITDRDICMCALFQRKPLYALRVADAMAKNVCACAPGDSLDVAEKTMRAARIRRLPVVDEEDALVGMISLADLAREAAREQSRQQPDITETEVGDTLAAICEPAGSRAAV